MSDPVAFGISPLHTSVPRDGGLRLDASGAEHLIVSAPVGGPTLGLVSEWAKQGQGTLALLCTGEPPVGLDRRVTIVVAPAAPALETVLRKRLARASVGLRLYVAGEERFVRRVEQIAREAGMLANEVRTEVTGGDSVRVWCTHCKGITETVARNVVDCEHCNRTLTVFYHYSRRHAAYMGFQADAEVRGEIPDVEAGLPCP